MEFAVTSSFSNPSVALTTHSSFSNPSVASLTSQLILQPFRCFTYVTAHSPTLPSLYLRHSSFSNPSAASRTSQFILQPFFRFSFVTSSSLGEPPVIRRKFDHTSELAIFCHVQHGILTLLVTSASSASSLEIASADGIGCNATFMKLYNVLILATAYRSP